MKIDESKLTPIKSKIEKRDLANYGNVRNIALPKALNALGQCNNKLYDIHLWNNNLPTNN